MKDKKIIYYIIAIFILISIATSPVLAENFKVENKITNGEINKQNNIVVVKAATTNGSANNFNSSNNSNINNTNKTSSNNQTKTAEYGGPEKLNQTEILKASVSVNKYVVKYKKLPNKVNIKGYDFSIPEYAYLLSKTIYYKYNKKDTEIIVKYGVNNPIKLTGTKVKGKLNSKQYYAYARNIMNHIEKNNKIPNHVNTKIGKIQYQTAVFGLNKILYWSHRNKNKMPSSLTLNIAKNHKMNKAIPRYTRQLSFTFQINPNMPIEDWITIQTSYFCGPTQTLYNTKYLISTGRCSCGKTGNYKYHEGSFKNYCPYCKISGTMIYEEGPTCPEGMWVCTKCDADFCLVTGKEHIIRSPKYLTVYITGLFFNRFGF